MNCPKCKQPVPIHCVLVEENESDLEVRFACPSCHWELFAILDSEDFTPVD